MAKPPVQIFPTFRINGTNGDDILDARAGGVVAGEQNSTFKGLIVDAKSGDDWILRDRTGGYQTDGSGRTSRTALNGGSGFDTLSYVNSDAGITANLSISATLNPTGGWLQGHGDLPKTGYGYIGTRTTDASPASHALRAGDWVRSIEKLVGSTHDDYMFGSNNADVLMGHDGDDIIHGAGGNDQLHGGNGHDTINGDGGHDKIYGDAGNDFLYGGSGNDTIYGGDGNDVIDGGNDNDVLHGGKGDDNISGGAGNDTIYGGDGDDVIAGGGGNDVIHVGDGVDVVDAGSGNDTIHLSGFGGNTVHGGTGSDTVVFSSQAAVNLLIGWAQRGTDGVDTLSSIENVTGSAYADGIVGDNAANVINAGGGADIVSALGGDDQIWAGSGADVVDGGDGDDTIYGGSGDDTIRGGEGDDLVSGGSGSDTFVWGVGDKGLDRIIDFNVNEDKFSFSEGFLAAGAWKNNLVATNVYGLGTTLIANTADDGWEMIAVMDYVNVATLNQRIDNGTIFNVQLNDDLPQIPGGLDFGGLETDFGIQLGLLL